ncbi:hypothetical protein [Cyclobacterium qasimii]|uniref:hypothetical protein n=1 Tax=Cyclobacterium qasimii TaxID=1350429 RepID=UPI0011BFE45C|nr:hypothetical protein [Cyclobacterium qasimii]
MLSFKLLDTERILWGRYFGHVTLWLRLRSATGNRLRSAAGDCLHSGTGDCLHSGTGDRLHSATGNRLRSAAGLAVFGLKTTLLLQFMIKNPPYSLP